MKIGLLEDNPAILDYMTVALEMVGHKVQGYTRGSALLDALLIGSDMRYPPAHDLIIVDLLLPGSISGVEAIERIRRVIPLSKLPVIIISAGSKEEIEYAKTTLPDVPILRKPFRINALLELVEGLKVP